MDVTEVASMHFVVLVYRGRAGNRSRAQRAAVWYQNAFGAHVISHTVHESGVGQGIQIHHAFYLRIGPIDSCVILEVRDADHNHT